MTIHYLEIVTPDVETLCAVYEAAYSVTFGDPVEMLGNARTADLSSGGRIGVRAPMSPDEVPAVRTYILVDDAEAAVKAAEASGAIVMHPPLEIPGQGTFAICKTAGIEHGFWQL